MARSRVLQPVVLLICSLTCATAAAQGLPALLHDPPPDVSVGEPLELDVVLDGPGQVKRLIVRHRSPGGGFIDQPMELAYGDLYRAVLSASSLTPPGVEYVIDAVLLNGKRIPAFPRNGKPLRIAVLRSGVRSVSQKEMDAAFNGEPREELAERPKSQESGKKGREDPKEVAKQREKDRRAAEDAKARELAQKNRRAPPQEDPPDEEPELPPTPVASTSSGKQRGPPVDALRSQLEQELAMYAADDPFTRASRQEPSVRRSTEFRTVLSREQILARGARVLHDVLSTIPGLSVSRDVQGFYRTGVRGLRNDAEILFLLNGHRLNNFYDGRALASLPVENLERVEVTHGPGPAYQGLNAFRAVVNVVTQRDAGVRGALSAGSFNTFDGSVSGGGEVDALRYFADADFRTQKGYQKPITQDVLANETAGQKLRDRLDPVGKTDDRRTLVNLGAGLTYQDAAIGVIGLALRFIHEDRGALVGMFDSVGENSALGWNVLGADLRLQKELMDKVALRIGVSTGLQSTDRRFVLSPPGFRVGESVLTDGAQERVTASVLSVGAVAAVDIRISEDHRLSFGLNLDQQSVTGFDYRTNTNEAGEALPGFERPEELELPQEMGGGVVGRRLALGFFVDDRWTLFEPLTLSLGLRVDAHQLPTRSGSSVLTGAALVPSLNPRLGLAFSATPAIVLRLSYGRAFRAPTVAELAEPVPDSFFARGRFAGNPQLEPVLTDSVQLGADWVQSVGSGQLRLTGTVFAEQISQPIIPVDTSRDTAMRNRDAVRIIGTEAEARLEISQRTSTFLNASFFRAEDITTPTGLRLLTDTPQAMVNGGVSVPMGPFLNFDFLVQAAVERRNNSRETLELLRRYSLPGYALVTAQLRSERIADHVVVTLTGNNMFDSPRIDDTARPDRMPGGVPREGVSGFLTVRGEL